MPKYQTITGETYEAESASALVEAMRQHSRAPETDLPAFVDSMAKRAELWSGTRPDVTDMDAFVRSLIEAKVVSVL